MNLYACGVLYFFDLLPLRQLDGNSAFAASLMIKQFVRNYGQHLFFVRHQMQTLLMWLYAINCPRILVKLERHKHIFLSYESHICK